MQIEFLEEGSPDCPLIRIFGVATSEFALFQEAIDKLARRQSEIICIGSLPGFLPVEISLLLRVAWKATGVSRLKENQFEWTFTPLMWATVAGLVEPFVLDPKTGMFQWLAGGDAQHGLGVGAISVLLSKSSEGRW